MGARLRSVVLDLTIGSRHTGERAVSNKGVYDQPAPAGEQVPEGER